MRRRLALVALAVSSLVVPAFIVPLATLVRNQAENRALSRAETDAQAVAATLAVAGAITPDTVVTEELADAVIRAFVTRSGISIILPDDEVKGAPVEIGPSISLARQGTALTARVEGGAEVLVPVIAANSDERSSVVVRKFVADDELSQGVGTAWALLAGLGVFLILVTLTAADWFGRSIVRPVTALAEAARALGGGDLDARVEPSGPEEIADVGEAFNFLASRLDGLLEAERESVADLSHRLRTPLTALRLQAETLSDRDEATSLVEDIDRMERAVNRLIDAARRTSSEQGATPVADLAAVVRHRAAYWRVLAEEQGRPCVENVADEVLPVALSPDELGAVVDTILANVFSHTPAGVGYRIVATAGDAGGAVLVVDDDGPGLPDHSVIERGESLGGSTGLGLDIASRAATATGGRLEATNRRGGGTRILIEFGPVVGLLTGAPARWLTGLTRAEPGPEGPGSSR